MNISEKTLEKLYGAAAVSMQKERYAAAEKPLRISTARLTI